MATCFLVALAIVSSAAARQLPSDFEEPIYWRQHHQDNVIPLGLGVGDFLIPASGRWVVPPPNVVPFEIPAPCGNPAHDDGRFNVDSASDSVPEEGASEASTEEPAMATEVTSDDRTTTDEQEASTVMSTTSEPAEMVSRVRRAAQRRGGSSAASAAASAGGGSASAAAAAASSGGGRGGYGRRPYYGNPYRNPYGYRGRPFYG